MKCPKCQFENPYTQRFCGDCGTKLQESCPECGSGNPPQYKFCGDCGVGLSGPESTQEDSISTMEFEAGTKKPIANFVGRTKETKKLKEVYELARSGSGQVVELEGEAGVGKSRLLYEFRKALPQGEFTYLEGRCYHYGVIMPYLPVLDILRTYFGLKDGEGELLIKRKIKEKASGVGGKSKNYLPPLQEILSLKVEDEVYLKMEPGQKRGRIFEAIRELFVREAQEKPLVLVFEDLHWIDKSSEDFLNYLFGSIENTPILLILPYRPQYCPQLEPKPYHSKIILKELPRDGRVELVQSILEHGDVVHEVVELILGKARGNPLFIEEVTQSLLENGFIKKERNQYILAGNATNIHLPDTIQEIIGARINRAGESIKRIMQVGSVIGSEFAFRTLQSMARMKEDLRSYLVSFEELAFLHESYSFPEIEYIFKHALIREVTYNGLLHRERKEIHGRIGTAIEALYAESIEEYYELLAYHYSHSDDLEKACHYLKLSGDKATRKYSLWEAMHFYREAIRIINQLPATEQNRRAQLEIRLSISTPMLLMGYPEGSLENFQEAERLAKERGDEKTLAILYSNLGLYYLIMGKPLLGIKYTEGPFQEAEKAQEIDLMAPIACQLCAAYLHSSQHSKLVDVASRVIARLEQTHRERDFFGTRYNVYSGLSSMCVFSLGMLGNFEEGKALYEKGLFFAQEVNSVYALGLLELYYGYLLNFAGDGKTAIGHLRKGIGCFEKAQAWWLLGASWSALGHAYYLIGDPESAQVYIQKAIKALTEKGIRLFLSFHHLLLSMTHFMSGDLQGAEKTANNALTASKNYNQKDFEGISLTWLGRILGRARTASGACAEKHIVRGIKICDELRLKPWSARGYLFLGELYADMRKKEKALENLKRAERLFGEMGMDYWLIRTKEVMGRR